MSRPPAARQKVLDAFVKILITEGERAATLDAVATEAGVSKGGLLYHFNTKEALVEGLLERMEKFARRDADAMAAAPEGAADYFLRTSVCDDDEFVDLYVAVSRLTGDGALRARAVVAWMDETWHELLADQIADPQVAMLVQLVSDGLYLATLRDAAEEGRRRLAIVLPLIRRLIAERAGRTEQAG